MTGLVESPGFITPAWDAPDNVVALTSLRVGGISHGPYAGFNLGAHVGDDPEAVAGNRKLLAVKLHKNLEFQWLQQVHGTDVYELSRCSHTPPEADAVVTGQPNVAACILTADCLPVFFATEDGRAVAIAHAGWRGLAAGILENTVSRLGVSPNKILAWLGPAIGPCHFQVGPEVREAFVSQSPEALHTELAAGFVESELSGKYRADLYRLARVKLNHLGIDAVGGGNYCTYCETERFYSYRRHPTTGRMVSLVYLRE